MTRPQEPAQTDPDRPPGGRRAVLLCARAATGILAAGIVLGVGDAARRRSGQTLERTPPIPGGATGWQSIVVTVRA